MTLSHEIAKTNLPPQGEPILMLEKVVVQRGGRNILEVANFAVKSQEVVALIGPNGAGKSTLMSVLACLLDPDRGGLLFIGQKVLPKDALSVRRQLAVVFQEPLLLDCSVLENTVVGLKLRGRKHGAEKKAAAWLERFGVGHLAHQNALTLSGGEAQRVSLARAFALEPKVLLLDEPFASIDLISKTSLISELKSILIDTGTTAVLVTHDFQEVLKLASRAVVLNQGRIMAQGQPQEIAQHKLWGDLAKGTERQRI